MIKNEHEYEISKAALARFEESRAQLEAAPLNGMHPRLRKAQIDATQSEIDVLRKQIEEYEAT